YRVHHDLVPPLHERSGRIVPRLPGAHFDGHPTPVRLPCGRPQRALRAETSYRSVHGLQKGPPGLPGTRDDNKNVVLVDAPQEMIALVTGHHDVLNAAKSQCDEPAHRVAYDVAPVGARNFGLERIEGGTVVDTLAIAVHENHGDHPG